MAITPKPTKPESAAPTSEPNTTEGMPEIYQTDKGIWHVRFKRYGRPRYSSLRTRDELLARQKLDAFIQQWSAQHA